MWRLRLSAVLQVALAGPVGPCKDGHMSTDDLPRLARAVKQRRLALGLARLAAAKQAGISKDTWQRVEEAVLVRDMSYAAIDPVLGWAVGSCQSIRAGGSPTPVGQSQAAPDVTFATVSDGERGAVARSIIESATIAVTDLPAAESRELIERIVGDLKRKGII